MYIFLDESGNLGFNFTKGGATKFFVMTVLVCANVRAVKAFHGSVLKTLKKINHGKKKNFNDELKGSVTPLHIKQYFLGKISSNDWSLHVIVVDKRTFCKPKYLKQTSHIYDYLAGRLFNKIELDCTDPEVIIRVDKCKSKNEVDNFNRRIVEVLYPKLTDDNKLVIKHQSSHEDKLIQAVDLFCNGLFEKYEHEDLSWYSCFENKILVEMVLQK